MYKIAFIGAGNISWSLIPALKGVGCDIIQLISRDSKTLNHFAHTYQIPQIGNDYEGLTPEVDFVFLTVPDQAIVEVAEKLPAIEACFLHTSGSLSLDSIKHIGTQTGAFYPMQTFTQQKMVDMGEVPIFIEGNNREIQSRLLSLAQKISTKVYEMNSTDRLRLHLGAVIASNFSNYLYQFINEVLPDRSDIDFSIYEGLIREQLSKALTFGPEQVQTGPAVRGDHSTIDKHRALLSEKPHAQELYMMISRLINPEIKLH